MSTQEWAALIVSIITIVAAFSTSVKWLVKHYLSELKPNSGSSLKDQVNRLEDKTNKLEEKLDHMFDVIVMNFFTSRPLRPVHFSPAQNFCFEFEASASKSTF